MSHLGDFDAAAVIYGKFATYRPSTGAAFTLGGTPALSVYKDNSTTQSTTGVTLTADFDAVTGLNHFAIDTSADGAFYAAGSFFDIVITTGTVDSVSVVGSVVGSFTLRKNSALKPATAGRTVVVDTAGLVDANAVKVGPTGAGTAQTAGDIMADTNDIQARLPAALTADGNMKADTLRVGGTLQTAKDVGAAVPAAAPGASGGLLIAGANTAATSFTAGMTISNTVGNALSLNSSGGNGHGLAAAGNGSGDGISAIGGGTGHGMQLIGGLTSGDGLHAHGFGVGNGILAEAHGTGAGINATITGDITGNLSGSAGSVTGLTASDVGAIKAKTDSLTFTAAGKVDANTLALNGTTLTGDGSATPWGPA